MLSEKQELWIADLYNFLHGNCTLVTDLTHDEILRRSTDSKALDFNPNFKKLWKNGKISVFSYPETFAQMETDNGYFNGKTTELFFIDRSEDFCIKVENTFGLVCSCPELMDKSIPRLFVFEIKSINKNGKVKSWDFLKNFRYPSNSAVVADNFILKDEAIVHDNLFQIIQNILPLHLVSSYDLTILTREVKDLDYMYNYINEYCLNSFPYKINLSICIADLGRLGFHDRDIITNNCLYYSGAGFGLFKRSNNGIVISDPTKVSIFPTTYTGHYSTLISKNAENAPPVQDNYFSVLNTYKLIWKELPDSIGLFKKFVGIRKNRLLD